MIDNTRETQLNNRIIMINESEFTDIDSYNKNNRDNKANIFKIFNQLNQMDLDRLETHFLKYKV
jgi:hypothetical protein